MLVQIKKDRLQDQHWMVLREEFVRKIEYYTGKSCEYFKQRLVWWSYYII